MQTKLSVFCDKFIEAGWLAAIITTPLFFNIYSSRTFEPDKLTLLRSIALAMAAAWIIKVLETAGRRPGAGEREPATDFQFFRTPLVLPTLLLVTVYTISTIASVTPRISFFGSYQRLQGTYTTLSYIVIFFLTLQGLRTREQIDRLVTTAILVSLPISLYGLLQRYGLDTLPWAADVSGRVASNMGNAIFVTAYLIMVIPLTMGRLVRSFSAILTEEEDLLANTILSACYVFILAAQVICALFAKSRGPWMGLMEGLFFFVLLLALIKRRRGLMLAAVGAALVLVAFLVVFNLPQSPLAPLRDAPYIGRMGRVFETERGTGLVRVLIWRGAVDMITFNPLRTIIGYGPESMFVAYKPFYPPELAHAEARTASPDRSHNETFDALVITGLIGFLAYMFVFVGIFYHGFKWLGLIRNDRQRNIFFGLSGAGGLASALFLWLWRGAEFIGVGLPLGIALGLAGYLVVSAFVFYEREKEAQGKAYQPLLISLLSGLMAHFVEIHFGIAIAATRIYFWVYAALMVVIGYYLRRRSVAEATAKRPKGRRSKRGKGRRPKSWAQTMDRGPAAIVASSFPVGMILATMGFDYISPQFTLAAKSYSMLWLFLITWALAGGIVLAEAALKRGRAKTVPHVSILLYALVSLGCLLVFHIAHSHQVSTLMALANLGDALGAANADANLIVVYYAVLFFLLLGMSGALMWRLRLPSQSWQRANWWIYPILTAGVVALIFTTNVNVIKADIIFKQADRYEGAGDWDTSIAIYRRAIELTPNEDYYYLFLGRAYLEKAKATSEPDQRAALFEESRKILERARQLNPLNTDHSANLARLYRTWGEMASDPAERDEKLNQALEYYRQATTLSPHTAQLFNEWGSLCFSMGEHEKALEKYQKSLSLDADYDQTYLLLGDLHLNRKELDEAVEAYKRALDLNPNLVQAHSALGYIYTQQDNLQKAMQENLRVLELAPNDYDSHKNLALIYRDLGRLNEAINEARIALELAPEGDKQSLKTLIAQLGGEQAPGSDEELIQTYLSQGQAYLAEKDFERAERVYLQVLELNPNVVQVYSALGYIYAYQGRLEESVEANLKVLELAPNDYDSHKNLAILYQQLERLEEAIAEAKSALELAPEGDKPALEDFIAQLEGQK